MAIEQAQRDFDELIAKNGFTIAGAIGDGSEWHGFREVFTSAFILS